MFIYNNRVLKLLVSVELALARPNHMLATVKAIPIFLPQQNVKMNSYSI